MENVFIMSGDSIKNLNSLNEKLYMEKQPKKTQQELLTTVPYEKNRWLNFSGREFFTLWFGRALAFQRPAFAAQFFGGKTEIMS